MSIERGPAIVESSQGPRARCQWILGPCVDGTQAGKPCNAPAVTDYRCARHTFDGDDFDPYMPKCCLCGTYHYGGCG